MELSTQDIQKVIYFYYFFQPATQKTKISINYNLNILVRPEIFVSSPKHAKNSHPFALINE